MKYAIMAIVTVLIAGNLTASSVMSSNAINREFTYLGYTTEGKLQYVLSGKKGTIDGPIIKVDHARLNVMQKNQEVKSKSQFSHPVYSLTENNTAIYDFWSNYNHVNCIILAEEANCDSTDKKIKGQKKVQFRSKAIDIDGTGFDYDSDKNILKINNNVTVILRAGPAKKERITENESAK